MHQEKQDFYFTNIIYALKQIAGLVVNNANQVIIKFKEKELRKKKRRVNKKNNLKNFVFFCLIKLLDLVYHLSYLVSYSFWL